MQVTQPITVTTSSGSFVYDIQRVSPELTKFANRAGGNTATMKQITYGFSAASSARKTDKFSVEIDLPLSRIDPIMGPVAKDVSRIRLQLTVPDTASPTERVELYDTLVQATQETLFSGSVKTFDLPT